MRRCLMSILHVGGRSKGLSRLTASKLYNTIVLPRGLYGAELWTKLTRDDITKLEQSHHYCLKAIQGFPVRSKSLFVQAMINAYSMEAYIDIKKLQFLGRLCRLGSDKLAKQVFLERFYQHLSGRDKSIGFVASD